MLIRLAVFDIAGTTLSDNNAVAKAFQQAFRMNGFAVTQEKIKPVMGYKKTVAIRMVLEKMNEEATEKLVNKIHEDFVNEMIDYYEYDPSVRPMAAAENVFQYCKEKGIRTALNTGFSKEIAQTILHRLQWKEKGLVDDCIASDEVKEGRPHPYMIEQLMYRAGIDDPMEVVKIGDTEADVNEGRNAGCGLVVAVTTGAYTREQLEVYKPDHILDSLDELPALIR